MSQKTKMWTIGLEDLRLLKNYELIQDAFQNDAVNKFDWRFLTFTTTAAVTNLLVPHGINCIPTDILSTRSEGGITFNYSRFTDKFLDVTTTGAATFRGLVGRHRENTE